jgi:hypothetical protein
MVMHNVTRRLSLIVLLVSALAVCAQETAVQAPAKAPAGSSLVVSTKGQGKGTLYLLGPNRAVKKVVDLGEEVSFSAEDVTASGLYQVVACGSSSCTTKVVEVTPGPATRLSFLLHPSRVPVSTRNAVNGTALVFDRYHNTVLTPTQVKFKISIAGQPLTERPAQTVRGVAFFQMDSRPNQGTLEVTATLGDTVEPRVIQQVASEACSLRMTATSSNRSVNLQTDPIRDCAGNPLPDGTIVSFTKIDGAGKSTVDTPIKKDRAIAQFAFSGPARISVACGVVVGNELSVGGQP